MVKMKAGKTNIRTKRLSKKYKLFSKCLENGLEGMGRGKGKLGRSERVAWTYIHYQM